MSLLSLTIRHLLACGASAEAVAKFVEEAEAAMAAEQMATIAAEREYERERKRTYRMSRMSRGQSQCPGDNGDKERSPIPPKENILLNITPLEGVQGKPLSRMSRGQIKSSLAECLFLEFWGVYPRRVGRGAARKAFASALKRAKPEEILAGAKRYAASCPDPQFTKHPSTWLNADCWLDEPVKPPKTNVVGFRKELAPEPPRPPRTPEEQARIDAQLAKLKRMP